MASQRRKPLVINPRLGFLLLGSILLTSAQTAHAGRENGMGFQEFRGRHAGMDRHVARKIFKDQFQDRQQRNQSRADMPATARNGTVINQLVDSKNSRPRQIRIEARNQSLQVNTSGQLVRLASGVNLDLNSEETNIVLGQKLFENVGSVEIRIGTGTKTVSAGDHVTAAEYVAVKQTLNGTSQTLQLNDNGQATSGNVDLSALTQNNDVMRADSLVVPVSVTATGDFTRGSDFRLIGDLDNFGTVRALASDGHSRSGTIRADNITNHEEALIAATTGLTLSANKTLTNHGTITSTQDLTLAAKQIDNDGSVSSERHVNLNANNINNSGQVISRSGNINIDVPQESLDSSLVINNTGGTLSALNGEISIRTNSYVGVQDTRLNGGNVLSKELNLNAGAGTIDVAANQLTGTVNSTGSAAHVTASTENLSIGSTCLTGDPTFFNTAGSIAIDGSITVAEALTIVASGNINLNNGSDLVAANATQGFPITLIAGASFTNGSGANQSTIGPIPPTNSNNGSITIAGGSATGGAINFNSSAGIDSVVSTRPTGGTGSGANVLLVAFAGSSGTSGRITTGNVATDRIFTGGKLSGNNGSITMIAPGLSNAGTFLPVLDTTGGSGTAGNITVTAADPILTNVSFNSLGAQTSGTIVPSAAITGNGSINFIDTIAGNGTITARANSVQVSGNTNMSARRIDLGGGTTSIIGDVVATSLVTVNGTGPIVGKAASIEGSITSPVSILTSGATIGTFGQELNIHGGTVVADGAAGVAIKSDKGLTIGGGSTQTGAFVISANGDTNIIGDVNLGNGSIDIKTTSGTLSASAVTLRTSNGNVNLSNLGVDKSSKVFLTGTNITALGSPGLGDVTISVGTPGTPVAGKAPKKNVNINIQNNGQIFYDKGITALAPTNNLSAKNANIFFNNPISRKNIVLSGATLVADP